MSMGSGCRVRVWVCSVLTLESPTLGHFGPSRIVHKIEMVIFQMLFVTHLSL